MVRATRATQLVLEDPPSIQPIPPTPPAKKSASKKRKRLSETDDAAPPDQQPEPSPEAEKAGHVKPGGGESEQDGDKEEAKERPGGKRQKTKQNVKEEEVAMSIPPPPRHKDAGEIPLSDADAEAFLSVLEAIDPDGLLDRQFQLPAEYAPSSSPHIPISISLGQILRDPSPYTSRALRSAISAISPEAPSYRATPSQIFQRQQQFCDVARDLLHQITVHQAGAVDTSRSTLDPDVDEAAKTLVDEDSRTTQYALHQQLPTGDFFTSAAKLTTQEAAAMTTGQASLVSVHPSVVIDAAFLPKLGSYARAPKTMTLPQYRLPVSSKVAAGTLLDYGPFASFAPIFDSDAGEITERELSDLVWSKRQRFLTRRKAEEASDDAQMEESSPTSAASPDPVIDPALELEDSLRTALEQLELESGIDGLLQKNAQAMQRLVTLQNLRYRQGEKAPAVQLGGEEWELANTIQNSLAALASLRPRKAGSSSAVLIPPSSILRALHRTLPIDPTPGWKGTLTRDRDIAYRDNSTITADATPYVNPTPAPPPPAPKPVPAPSIPSYPQYPQYQRPGLPATTSSYYATHPYYAQYANQAGAAAGAKTPAAPNQPYYYPYPQYPGYVQQPVYNQQPGTPGQQTRAIPNMAKQASQYVNGWATGTPSTTNAATLPMHLRKTGGIPTTPTTPATPGAPMTMGYGAGNSGTASPVYPPAMSAGYGTGYPGWPQPKT